MPPLDIVVGTDGRHKHRPVLDTEDVVVDPCAIYVVNFLFIICLKIKQSPMQTQAVNI